jgi:hypothetical protein
VSVQGADVGALRREAEELRYAVKAGGNKEHDPYAHATLAQHLQVVTLVGDWLPYTLPSLFFSLSAPLTLQFLSTHSPPLSLSLPPPC